MIMANGFCGPLTGAHSVDEGVLANECFLNGLSMFPHLLMLLLSIPITVVWKKAKSEEIQSVWVHFPGHKIRWILTIILIILNFAEIGEGIISDSWMRGIHFHLFILPAVSLCGSIVSIVYYHYVETWNSPRFLLLLIMYWIGALITKSLKVVNLFSKGLNTSHVRFDLTWDVIIIYFLLLLVEFNVIRSLKYIFFKHPVVLLPPEELSETKYYQKYVNLLSKGTFFWINKLLLYGYKHQIQMDDLSLLNQTEMAGNNFVKLRRLFEIDKHRKKDSGKMPSLWWCYAKYIWPQMVLGSIFKFLGDLLAFIGPLCISGIIAYVESLQLQKDNNVPSALNYTSINHTSTNATMYMPERFVTLREFITNGYVLVFIMLFASIFKSIFYHTHHFFSITEGIKLRAAMQGMVYHKALHLSSWELSGGNRTPGQIINHISTDPLNLMYFCYFINYAWNLPVLLCITMVLLYLQLGYSALLGGLILLLLIPVQYLIGTWQSKISKKKKVPTATLR